MQYCTTIIPSLVVTNVSEYSSLKDMFPASLRCQSIYLGMPCVCDMRQLKPSDFFGTVPLADLKVCYYCLN